MKRKNAVDVEPLSEARWAAIDAAVMASLDERAETPARTARAPSRRALWIVAAGAVSVAAAMGGLFLNGSFTSRHEWVREPSHIETGSASSHLALGFASIEVGPDTSVTANGDEAHGMLLVLEKGSVDCEVLPRRERPAFVVQAGGTRVRVVGTRFIVRTSQRSGAAVEVKHGTVEVTHEGVTIVLHDGERWPAAPPASPPPVASAPMETPPSTPETSASTRTSAVPPAARKGEAGVSDQRAYDQAIRNEGTDPEGSMATYRRMVARGGPWAPNALFAAGRLAAERGQRAEARRLLEQYAARYPNGANAEDSRKLLTGLQ